MSPANARAMIAALPEAIRARIAAELEEAAARVAADARALLEGTSGSPAALGRSSTDPSGILVRSIVSGRDPDSGVAVVTVDTPYAAALEYGTARMAARPFLRPAAAQAESEIRGRLAAALAETCRAALDDAP